MADKIVDIEGIGPAYAAKLNAAGIQDTDDLFAKAGIKANRAKLAEETGISEKLILSWCNMADLMRLKGVGGQFAELLHAAGIDSCKELAQRKAEHDQQVALHSAAANQLLGAIENCNYLLRTWVTPGLSDTN